MGCIYLWNNYFTRILQQETTLNIHLGKRGEKIVPGRKSPADPEPVLRRLPWQTQGLHLVICSEFKAKHGLVLSCILEKNFSSVLDCANGGATYQLPGQKMN